MITVTPPSDEYPLDLDGRRECPSPTPGLIFREPSSSTVSDGDILFSYHSFLATGSLSHIPTTDFKFLETKGCFHLPARPVLDEFVVEYFRHVHPMLPILDEGAFWNMYLGDGQLDQQAKKISLFTFRAMLFVASSVSFCLKLVAAPADETVCIEGHHQSSGIQRCFRGEIFAVSPSEATLRF